MYMTSINNNDPGRRQQHAVAALRDPKRDAGDGLRKRRTLAPGLQGRLDGPRARGEAPAGLEREHRFGVAAPLLRQSRVDVGRVRRRFFGRGASVEALSSQLQISFVYQGD